MKPDLDNANLYNNCELYPADLLDWQKVIIDERLDDYNDNRSDIMDFRKTLDEIGKQFD